MFPDEAVHPDAVITPESAFAEATVKETAASVEQPTPTETSQPEPPAGLAGFFSRLFGGGSNQESAAAEPAALVTAEPVPSTPAVAVAAQPTEPAAPRLNYQQMEGRLLETINITENDLHELANARAEAVRAQLETIGQIAPERLFIVPPEDPAKISADSGQPQVSFNLE